MYFLCEEFWLILITSWWVIVYSFLHPINMSNTWGHKFYWFSLISTEFWPLFDLKLLIFLTIITLELEEILGNGKRLSSWFCCSFKFRNKKNFIACIQLRMTKRLSRKVMNFRHLLGCDTIGIVARNFKAFSGVLSFQELNIFQGLGFELSADLPVRLPLEILLTNEQKKL